ncbi:hypothetical protein RIF29_28802 [Crotalaria pallida]|uniref:Uncharacterized protein n=1 Tax=Crotalaria pallida TaxID=3830 RepID=A0AAN9EK15_CROPI
MLLTQRQGESYNGGIHSIDSQADPNDTSRQLEGRDSRELFTKATMRDLVRRFDLDLLYDYLSFTVDGVFVFVDKNHAAVVVERVLEEGLVGEAKDEEVGVWGLEESGGDGIEFIGGHGFWVGGVGDGGVVEEGFGDGGWERGGGGDGRSGGG